MLWISYHWSWVRQVLLLRITEQFFFLHLEFLHLLLILHFSSFKITQHFWWLLLSNQNMTLLISKITQRIFLIIVIFGSSWTVFSFITWKNTFCYFLLLSPQLYDFLQFTILIDSFFYWSRLPLSHFGVLILSMNIAIRNDVFKFCQFYLTCHWNFLDLK